MGATVVKRPPTRTRRTTLLLIAITVGCGGGEAGKPEVPPTGGDAQPARANPAAAPAGPPAESAARAVRAALDGFSAGKPQVLWELMPPSHRDDLTELVHGFASQIDGGTWAATVAAIRRTVVVLRDRKAWFLSHPLIAARNGDAAAAAMSPGIDPLAGVRENWDATVSLVERIANSELADHAAVRSLDVGAFLAGTGRDVAETVLTLAGPEVTRSIRADVGRLTIETISERGDRATLRIGGGPFDPVDHEFVRIEGHWLPANVAAGWTPTMRQTRERLERWNFDDTARRAWHDRLAAWTATIDALETTENEADFHARFDVWIASLSPPAAEPPASEPTPKGTIVVQVDALLDLAEEDRIQVLLNSAAADPDLAVAIPSRKGDATRFEVSHAGTLHGFAERVRRVAGLTVVDVDEKTQRIRVRLGG